MKTTSKKRTQVYNVIILDRSGSMSAIRQAAIDGFNETLAGIRKAQEKFAQTQEHYVSLVAFCNCKTDAIFDKVPVGSARPITEADYEPCCGTPLYDAMGFTLTAMRKHVSGMADAVVVVTIITDGMENASREYSRAAIQSLVGSLRGEGWTFTYMGANQDSGAVAASLSIRNARNFHAHELLLAPRPFQAGRGQLRLPANVGGAAPRVLCRHGRRGFRRGGGLLRHRLQVMSQ